MISDAVYSCNILVTTEYYWYTMIYCIYIIIYIYEVWICIIWYNMLCYQNDLICFNTGKNASIHIYVCVCCLLKIHINTWKHTFPSYPSKYIYIHTHFQRYSTSIVSPQYPNDTTILAWNWSPFLLIKFQSFSWFDQVKNPPWSNHHISG